MLKSLHVKYLLFLLDFNGSKLLNRFSKQSSNTQFNQNPSAGSRVVPCEQMAILRMRLKICFIEFPVTSVNKLETVEQRNSDSFMSSIHFAAPLTLLHRAPARFASRPSSYVPVYNEGQVKATLILSSQQWRILLVL
jgi:hypothetical protein